MMTSVATEHAPLFALVVFLGVVCAYFLGAIPSAIIVGKRFFGVDVREHGSGNTGTTNVMRVLGFKPGLIVFACDVSKGILGVLVTVGALGLAEKALFDASLAGATIFSSGWTYDLALLATALAAVLGHVFSPFLHFKGGKGVATALGAYLAVMPLVGLVAFALFLVLAFSTRYVSLASICAAFTLPFLTMLFYHNSAPFIVFSTLCAVLLIVAHRENIKRLIHHEEKKFSFGSVASKQAQEKEE